MPTVLRCVVGALAAAMAILTAGVPPATSVQVPLVVTAPAGGARSAWPVAAGLPLPPGALRPGDGLRLRSPRGEEVPLQAQATTWWPDGSVRSLLLDALVDLPAGGRVPLRLEFGANLRRGPVARPLHLEETADRLVLETGAATITVNRRSFPLFSMRRGQAAEVWLEDGIVLDESGKALDVFSARRGRLFRVEVEERGPIRAAVVVEGEHAGPGSPIPFRLRLHAFAGKAFVRVEHFLANPDGRLGARQVSLRFGASLSASARYLFGGEAGRRLEGMVRPGEGVVLWQEAGRAGRSYEVRRLGGQGQAIARGTEAEGWAAFGGEEGEVVVATEDFDGPYGHGRGFAMTPERRIDILLAGPGSKVPYGMTSRMAIGIAKNGEDLGRALADRLYAVAPAAWYASSGVLGPLIPLSANRLFPEYSGAIARVIDQAWRQRAFGSYYDVAQSWFAIFAMTGDPRALRLGHQAATLHWDHDLHHVGPRRGIRTIEDTRHIYAEGPLAAYLFTGDRLALDMAREVADGILARLPEWEGYIQGYNERSGAWPLISLVATYEATLDERYLGGARWIVNRVLAWQHPKRGGWIRTYEDPEECPYGDQGGSPFMTALLMEGLSKYHRVTGDPRVPGSLWQAADWLIREAWWPSLGRPDLQTFLYIQCRAEGSAPFGYGETWDLNPMIAAGLAAAYRAAADPRHLEVAVQALRAGLAHHAPKASGKPFAQFFRSSGMALAQAHARGTREVPLRPGSGGGLAAGNSGSGRGAATASMETAAGPWVRVGGAIAAGATDRPPVLEGRLGAGEWAPAATATPFVLPGGEGVAREQTVLHVMADGEALYLGFELRQSRSPAPPRPSAPRRLWTEDSVEIFLAPDPTSGRYFQFIAAADGARYQSLGKYAGWHAVWEAVPGRDANGWTLEVRIPFAALGARPEGAWGFNVCRNQAGDGEKSCWVAPLGPYHNPHRFGQLRFGGTGLALAGDVAINRGEGDRQLSVRLEQRHPEGYLIASKASEVIVPARGQAALPMAPISPGVAELRIVARDVATQTEVATEVLRRRLSPPLELALVPARYVTAGQTVVARAWLRTSGPAGLAVVLEGPEGSGTPVRRWRGEGPSVFDFAFSVGTGAAGERTLSARLIDGRASGAGPQAIRRLTVVEDF